MTVQIAHIGDMHFGGLANVPVVEALERMLPDLRPDAIVIGGDLSQRARHGEFQRGRAFANLCRATAPVLNHGAGGPKRGGVSPTPFPGVRLMATPGPHAIASEPCSSSAIWCRRAPGSP